MQRWLLLPLLSLTLLSQAHADDLKEQALQIKLRLQTQWLPALTAIPAENEDTVSAALNLQTLSHAYRLGYGTPQLDLLAAARRHYLRLRDALYVKTNGTFSRKRGKTYMEARVLIALVEYARASGENEPRILAIDTWNFIRKYAYDKTNGGYYEQFYPINDPGNPNIKAHYSHSALLGAATDLFKFTGNESLKVDVAELLDLNENRFFALPVHLRVYLYTNDWKRFEPSTIPVFMNSEDWHYAGVAILRAQKALGVPVRWVDFVQREETDDGPDISALTSLAPILSDSEAHAAQLDVLLDKLNANPAQPPIRDGITLLDFVAAFEK